MKRLLRWGGLAISISTYVALTIWANTFAGEAAISGGESATRAAMQPFWILTYIGVAMFIASWLVPGRGQDHYGSAEKEQPKSSERSLRSSDPSERQYTPLSPEAVRRTVQHLRDEARMGNLRPRKFQPDPAEGSPEE